MVFSRTLPGLFVDFPGPFCPLFKQNFVIVPKGFTLTEHKITPITEHFCHGVHGWKIPDRQGGSHGKVQGSCLPSHLEGGPGVLPRKIFENLGLLEAFCDLFLHQIKVIERPLMYIYLKLKIAFSKSKTFYLQSPTVLWGPWVENSGPEKA